MSRPRALRVPATLAILLILLLAGCSSQAGTTDRSLTQTHVQVDTAALRALKHSAGVQTCEPGHGAAAAGSLPAVTLPCLGGGPAVDLARLKGPLVLNLFAQWCGPCRSELPYYQELDRKAAGKVHVVGVDYLDTQPAQALDLAKSTGVTYPLLADPAGDLRAPLRVRGLPGVVFVSRSGKVSDVEFVEIRSYHQLTDLVRQHLGVTL